MLRIGIIGLSQVGKTTLFRILTHSSGAPLASGKPETHVGVVHVPDARLDRLAEIFKPQKTTYASIEYMDTPGSVIDLARSGIQSANLREFDALAHVVRAFDDELIPAPNGVNPERDIEGVELELMLSDLAIIEKRLARLEKDVKKQKNPTLEKEQAVLETAKTNLEKQIPLRELPLDSEQARILRGFTFFTLKPMLYVLNLGEKESSQANAAEELAKEVGLKPRPKTAVAAICGKVEAELAELSEPEASEFLVSYGLQESALARLIRSSYHLLGLISFFTAGDPECRAWTIRAGATALEAAGEIHSDIQKKFIRAEVVSYDDLVKVGSFAEARRLGLLKLEGKEYVFQDGEVVYFRHSA